MPANGEAIPVTNIVHVCVCVHVCVLFTLLHAYFALSVTENRRQNRCAHCGGGCVGGGGGGGAV